MPNKGLALEVESGYADIYKSLPYIDWDIDGERVLVHMLYVPPVMRLRGEGKRLFKQLLANLPDEVKYIRLKSASLGSGDTLLFWFSLGFRPAYECECEDTSRILHLAINGCELPEIEILNSGEERHYIFD